MTDAECIMVTFITMTIVISIAVIISKIIDKK